MFWAVMFLSATNVNISSAIIRVVAIAIVQSANRKPVLNGRTNSLRAILRSRIIIWFLLRLMRLLLVPHQLNAWAQLHPQTIYNILFQAAWKTLHSFSKSHKRLRGQLGVTSVLHIWGQNLNQHIHLHCLIPGIALSANNSEIETTKSQYLYPVEALKKKFRGIAVSLLRQAWQQGHTHALYKQGKLINCLMN